MATPWPHPDSGIYHLRRQIPKKLRPAFGNKILWKETLNTKDHGRACTLFIAANAALEARFEEARVRLAATGDPRPCQRDRADELVLGYFERTELREGGLDGFERLRLSRIELDAGLWNHTPNGCAAISSAERWWALAGNTVLFPDYWNYRP